MASLRRWLLFLRVPLVLIGIFLFFALYNRFLLNANLQNLRRSLSVLDAATSVGQSEAALLMVDQTLIAQMGQEKTDLPSLSALQYAQGTLASAQIQRPVEDAQAMLEVVEEGQSAARSPFLNPMDGLVIGIQGALQQAALFPKQVFSRPGFPEIDDGQLQEAARLERLGWLREAAKIYEGLLRDYPNYSERSSLKLRLGYAYQRTQEIARAEHLYREVLQEARTLKEAQTARQMLEKISRLPSEKKEAENLGRRLSSLKAGPERQEAAFKMGSLLIETYELQKAPAAFRQAFLADPEGKLALPALFKEGWCLRTAGRFEEALAQFNSLIGRDPGGSWGTASYLQIAEIYKALGDYSAAASIYEQASAHSKDDALNALAYASAGSTYLFDLNNPEKARIFFRDLEKRFPASAFSSVGTRSQVLQQKKGTMIPSSGGQALPSPAPAPPPRENVKAFSLEEGGPVVKWLEGFLPVFVDVFSDRLAKYMHAVGEKSLTRRFTDLEFRELVVRQVEKRFPGQVTDIQTKIHPTGFVGSGNVKLGILKFSVQATIGIKVVEEKPHALIQEIKIGPLVIPQALQKLLETRINMAISRTQYPLNIKEYELREGYALISVELPDEMVR